jgi:hypothetical protein
LCAWQIFCRSRLFCLHHVLGGHVLWVARHHCLYVVRCRKVFVGRWRHNLRQLRSWKICCLSRVALVLGLSGGQIFCGNRRNFSLDVCGLRTRQVFVEYQHRGL